MPGQHGAAQVQMFQQGIEVGGEGVVVIPGRRLAGLAEPAPVVGDDPVPGVQQDPDLLVPGAAAERVAVDQHDGQAGTMILVVDLDVGAVFLADGDCGHGDSFRWRGGTASASRSGMRVAPVIVTGRCSGPRSGPRPYSLRAQARAGDGLGARGHGGESPAEWPLVTEGPDRWHRWLLDARFGGDAAFREKYLKETLYPVRDAVLDQAQLRPDDSLLDVGAGDGLIAFGALARLGPSSRVIFSDISQDLPDHCRRAAAAEGLLDRCDFVLAAADSLA